MAKTGDILRIINRTIPESLAQSWDNSGMQVGSLHWEARGVIVSLDADISMLNKAREAGANIAVTHHPLIFGPIKQLDLDAPLGKVMAQAVRDQITIYSAHTNLDAMERGVNDTLAQRMGLLDVKPFADMGRIGELSGEVTLEKLTTTVKKEFYLQYLTIVGRPERRIKKVAVCGGSGGSLVRDAAENGADLLITGDVKYHAAKDAEAYNIAVMDIGHFSSESVIIPVLASLIKDTLEKEGIKIGVHIHWGSDPLRVC